MVHKMQWACCKFENNTAFNCSSAGVADIPYGVTVEGYEHHFQVNYLSHVLLTLMLLPKLHESSTPNRLSRIVNVSSVAHYGAYPDLEDPQMKYVDKVIPIYNNIEFAPY